jgi:hypothetical protein
LSICSSIYSGTPTMISLCSPCLVVQHMAHGALWLCNVGVLCQTTFHVSAAHSAHRVPRMLTASGPHIGNAPSVTSGVIQLHRIVIKTHQKERFRSNAVHSARQRRPQGLSAYNYFLPTHHLFLALTTHACVLHTHRRPHGHAHMHSTCVHMCHS